MATRYLKIGIRHLGGAVARLRIWLWTRSPWLRRAGDGLPKTILSNGREASASGQNLPSVRMPIRFKITVPYMLLALALAMTAAFVVTRILFDSLEERFTNQLIETGKLASSWMVREEDRLLETLRLVANTEGVDAAIHAGDGEQLRQIIYPLAVNAQEEVVEVLSTEGIAVLSMRHRPAGNVEDYAFTQGGDAYRNWPFVRQVLTAQADARGDKFAGMVVTANGPVFYVAGPVYDQRGQRVGAVLIGKTLTALARQIRSETLAQVSLYTGEGEILATTFFEGTPLAPETTAEVKTRGSEISFLREVDIDGIGYAELLGVWRARGDVDLGVIGTALPESFLIQTSSFTRLQIFAVATLGFLLVIYIGTYVANRITKPLLSVVQASSEVATGNFDVQLDLKGNDEVTVLADSFNRMVSNLKLSQDQLIRAYDSTLEGWSKALELRDEETEGHTQRVTALTLRLAVALGVPEEQLGDMRRGALLHDIGKMAVPDSILMKPGSLSDEEWDVMKKHPQHAYDMLWPIEYLRPALDIPYCHHERWDGSGYPRGLKGEEIPVAARIFAVADVWDALTSDRPYRPAMSDLEAYTIILEQRGVKLDPDVVDAFIQLPEYEQRMKAA